MSSQVVSFLDCSADCPRVAELEEEIEELKEEVAVKEEVIKRLRGKLRKHENPHVPSSQKRETSKTGTSGEENDDGGKEDESNEEVGGSQEKLDDENDGGRGRKTGHDGETRKTPEPDRTEVVFEERCENCGRELGDPDRVETRIVEDIPDPGSVEVVEYEIEHYDCGCGEETVAAHEDIPEKGNFGPNVLVQTTLLKFQERVPYGKIQSLFEDVYELKVSTNTLYNFTGRVAGPTTPVLRRNQRKK